jgi:hypothetical protein
VDKLFWFFVEVDQLPFFFLKNSKYKSFLKFLGIIIKFDAKRCDIELFLDFSICGVAILSIKTIKK